VRLFRTKIYLIAIGILCQAIPLAVKADNVGGRILHHPYGVRSYGMGRTGVADDRDPTNLFYNPANLASVRGVHATWMYEELLPEATTDMWFMTGGISGAYQIELQNARKIEFGLDLRYNKLDYGTIIPTNAMGEEGGSLRYL
jgi:hypothetical protein